MEHIEILFLVLNLIIGTSVIIYINNLRREFNDAPLRNLFLYMLSFNLFIFVAFNYKYTLYNIYGNNFNGYSVILGVILYFLISLAEAGMVYYLYLTSVSLKKGNESKLFKYSLILLVTTYGAGSIFGMTIYYLKSVEIWLYFVHMVWIFTIIGLILSIFIDLYLFSRKLNEPNRKALLSSFALITSIGFLFFALSNLDFYFIRVNISALDPLIFAIINISPFVWVKFFYLKQLSIPKIDTSNSNSFQNVIVDFNISGREIDVIKLIVDGKSNKEIEDMLNISVNTVKNHIYNVYKKIGVNSRSQLIRFINDYSKTR